MGVLPQAKPSSLPQRRGNLPHGLSFTAHHPRHISCVSLFATPMVAIKHNARKEVHSENRRFSELRPPKGGTPWWEQVQVQVQVQGKQVKEQDADIRVMLRWCGAGRSLPRAAPVPRRRPMLVARNDMIALVRRFSP